MKKFDISVKFVTTTDPEDFRKAIDEKTKAFYVESIGNPKYIVADLPVLSKIAHDNGIPVIVDNTFGMGGTYSSYFLYSAYELLRFRLPYSAY